MNIEKRVKTLETLIVLATASLLFFYLFGQKKIFIILSLVFLLLSLVYKKGAQAVAGAWEKFSLFIGDFNSKVILSVIYFLILTPISFIYRIFHPNAMKIKKDNSLSTYYEDKAKVLNKEDFENMF
jgi:O-antigen ligase